MFDKYNYKKSAEAKERNLAILKKYGWELISPYTKASEHHEFLHPSGKKIIQQMFYITRQLSEKPNWSPREIGEDYGKKIANSRLIFGEKQAQKTLTEYGWELLEPYKGARQKHKVKAPDGNEYIITLHMALHHLRLKGCYTPIKNSLVGNVTQKHSAKPQPKTEVKAIVVNTNKQVSRQCVRCSNHFKGNILDTVRICPKCRKFKYG